jgi:hypothetical protein
MTPNLSRYLNKTVFASIPALFDDGVCRPYKLLGADLTGLWLQSEELTQRLVAGETQYLASLAPVVFVPFAQIAGVLLPTAAPAQPPASPPPSGADGGAAEEVESKPENPGEAKAKRGAKKP